ncbi:MAG: hypothetical protein K2M73_09195 [Lachnospiraceae bacterium]|nr:hypothetical protein [Lachnospiraceae bacterium]
MALIHNVFNQIVNILQNKIDIINVGYNSKGGIEKWFQVELLYALINEGLNVEREAVIGVEDDFLLCDFYISDSSGNIYVELKVDTEGQNIADKYVEDINKIDIIRDVTGNPAYAVLISKAGYAEYGFNCVGEVNGYKIFIQRAE